MRFVESVRTKNVIIQWDKVSRNTTPCVMPANVYKMPIAEARVDLISEALVHHKNMRTDASYEQNEGESYGAPIKPPYNRWPAQ